MAKKSVKADSSVSEPWKNLKLAGTVVHFAGRFEKWGSASLDNMERWAKLEGAKVVPALDAKVTYLVLKELKGNSGHEKKAAQLNAKGASITVLDPEGLKHLLSISEQEAAAMLQAGEDAQRLLRDRLKYAGHSKFTTPPWTIHGLKLAGKNLKSFELGCADLVEADLSKSTIHTESYETFEFRNVRKSKLDGAKLNCTFLDMTDCSCKSADLSGSWIGFLQDKSRCSSNFTGATMARFHFCHSDLAGSVFEKADLTNATFEGVKNAAGVSFRGACLKDAKAEEKPDFSGADFSNADWSNAELVEAKFAGCNLTRTKFCNATLMNAKFKGAILDRTDFTGANVAGADFSGADTSKAIGLQTATAPKAAAGPKLKELSDLCKNGETFETTMEVQAPLERIRLSVRMRSPQFRASWTRDLWADTLTDWTQQATTLTAAMQAVVGMWPSATPMPNTVVASGTKMKMISRKLTQLAMEAWCEACGIPCPTPDELQQLSQSAESDKNQVRASLLADLDKPKGVTAWNARGRLDLETVKSFPSVDLSHRTLDDLNLSSLEFDHANFEESSLKSADFDFGSFKHSNFRSANLKSFAGQYSQFDHCDFSGADLSDSKMTRASLQQAQFGKAKLKDADLSECKLQGSNLKTAQLSGCMLKSAEFDEATVFPKGFSIPDTMKWKGKDLDPRAAEIVAVTEAQGTIDMPQFMKIVEASIEKERLKKALSMLKAERFRLFAEATDEHLIGVVKSQNDPDLVYSCRLDKEGQFACCTQNLNPCGGLRGSLCKHLLVLIIGVTNAGELDPARVNAWISASRRKKPELDKDKMGETLLRYKGAEAGEIDWRPTETIPEDYFAL